MNLGTDQISYLCFSGFGSIVIQENLTEKKCYHFFTFLHSFYLFMGYISENSFYCSLLYKETVQNFKFL